MYPYLKHVPFVMSQARPNHGKQVSGPFFFCSRRRSSQSSSKARLTLHTPRHRDRPRYAEAAIITKTPRHRALEKKCLFLIPDIAPPHARLVLAIAAPPHEPMQGAFF